MSKTFSGVPGDSKCECADAGCAAHSKVSECRNVATTILYRVDMEDATGTAFCEACADDAMDSGLFTESVADEDEPFDNEADWPNVELLSNSDADYRDRD